MVDDIKKIRRMVEAWTVSLGFYPPIKNVGMHKSQIMITLTKSLIFNSSSLHNYVLWCLFYTCEK